MYVQGGGEKLLNEAILNWDFSCLYENKSAGCVSSCSEAAELREITSMGVCSVGREHCSTAALQLDSWDTAAGDTPTCNLVFLEHTRGTHDLRQIFKL